MKSNCIITGGAGFVGSHLTEYFLKTTKFNKIYIVDNLVRTNGLRNIQYLLKNYPDKLEFIYGDASWFDFTTISNVSIMFHLAATRINRCVKYPLEGHTYITDSGFNVVNYCAKNKVFLYFASSASVYASPKKFPIMEDDTCIPPTLYGSSKLYTEHIILNFAKTHGLKYSINRYFSVYGPRMDCDGVYTEVIFNWLNNIKNNNYNITVYGDPDKKILDMVYIDDVIFAIKKSIDTENNIFNVSSENGITLTKLIKIIEEVAEKKLIINQKEEIRNDIENKRVGSTMKLRQIGWEPKISIKKGISYTYDWITTLE